MARGPLGGCSHAILCSENSGVARSRFVAACTTVDSTGMLAAAATAVVTTSSVCSGNGDRSQEPKRSSHQVADCSVSPDEVASMPAHPLYSTPHRRAFLNS